MTIEVYILMHLSKKKLFKMSVITAGGGATFCGICLYKGDSRFYHNYAIPLVHKLDPETAHKVAVKVIKYKLASTTYKDPQCLKTKLAGIELSNPVGIAAGFDKHGEAVLGLEKIGFGFCEVGTVTPLPQCGNPRPRVFRLSEDRALINRYGFNSEGHNDVHSRLVKLKGRYKGALGVNLGKNKLSTDAGKDYAEGLRRFSDVADYFVINISSPNTAELRELQKGSALVELLDTVIETRRELDKKPPLFIKLSPDLTFEEQQQLATEVMKRKDDIEGVIVSNTTVRRTNIKSVNAGEVGGLSGEPLAALSTQLIRNIYTFTNGQVKIIGVGGIASGQHAYDKILAGASLLQLYTSFAYAGPPIITKVKQELVECLRKDGYDNVTDAVGAETKLKKQSS